MYFVSLGETFNNIVFVFPDTLFQIARHADIDCAISLTGKEVNVKCLIVYHY